MAQKFTVLTRYIPKSDSQEEQPAVSASGPFCRTCDYWSESGNECIGGYETDGPDTPACEEYDGEEAVSVDVDEPVREPSRRERGFHVEGIFSQKKILWDMVIDPRFPASKFALLDDVRDQVKEMKYSTLCSLLTDNGRAHILDGSGKAVAFVIAAMENEVRGEDLSENGVRIRNPAAKKNLPEPVPGELL